MRLSAALSRALRARRAQLTAEARDGISDLQFTARYRVPFQFSRLVREHLPAGTLLRVLGRRHGSPISTATQFYDLTGSYGVNLFGNDFYKGMHRARRAAGARIWGRCSAPIIRWSQYNVRAPARDLGPGRGVVPHVGHRGRDAGGAAGALSHAAARSWCASAARITAGGATCSRASATRRPTRDTFTLSDMNRRCRCACSKRAATSPACWSIRCRRCIRTAPRRPIRRWSTASRRAHFDRAAYAQWLQRLREVCTRPRHRADLRRGVHGLSPRARAARRSTSACSADMVTYGKTLGGGLAGRRAVRPRGPDAPLPGGSAGRHLLRARHLQRASLCDGRDARVPAAPRARPTCSALLREAR